MSAQIEGVKLIHRTTHRDNRGWFMESFNKEHEMTMPVIKQISHSWSKPHTRRGLHFQTAPMMEKLVTVLVGEVRFIIVDLRRTAKTYGLYQEVWINESDHNYMFVPKYCALGFEVPDTHSMVQYFHSEVHDPTSAITIATHSSILDIPWKIWTPVISEKDEYTGLSWAEWRNHKDAWVFDRM